MISDITIGQFFPGDSILHRLDPRLKLCAMFATIIFLFVASNYFALGLMVFFVVAAIILSGVPIKLYIKGLKPVLIIVLFTSVLQLFYGSGEPLVRFWVFTITKNGISNSIFISIRIVATMLAASLLTYTTSPNMLMEAIERLLSPLAKLRVPVHDFAMMMSIALRFIPTLLEEADKIMSAQKARGADLESGGLIQRVKALIPILIPLFVSAFRRAFDLSTAMEGRCYHGGNGRTKMNVLNMKMRDYLVLCLMICVFTLVIALNRFFPTVFMVGV